MGNASTVYQAKKAASLGNVTSTTVFLQSDSSSKTAAVFFPTLDPSGAVNAVAFRFYAWGRSTAGTSGNFTPVVYYGTSTTVGSNTSIAAASARTNATTCNWRIWGTLTWDGTTQKLTGEFAAINGSTATLDASAVTTTVSTVDLTTAGNGLTVTALFGTSNASNAAFLDGLTLEVI